MERHTRINWHEVLGGGNKYTWKELKQKINPSQSSVAEDIIMNLLTCGTIVEKQGKIYQVVL